MIFKVIMSSVGTFRKTQKKIHANMLKKKYPPNIAKYNTFTVFTG